MAFYYLNKLDKSISKKELEKEFRNFGDLKFIGSIQSDKRDDRFNSTIAVFNDVKKTNELNDYCKRKKIFIKERIEKESNSNSQTEKKEFNDKRKQENIQPNIKIYNPSFHFYKDEAYGKDIEKFQFSNEFNNLFEIKDSLSFELTTSYPGLLVGSGYNHPKLKENTDDFQLGFFFDHTSGLPIISGSSIKGVLKSILKNTELIKDLYEEIYTEDLSDEIFEDNKTVFYDAFITSTKNKDKKIFGSDYITSHYSNEENGEFKNPNPIKFLKILPEVTFKFQFKCDEKYKTIFEEIIKDFGLGAKTNVGYGKFI